MLRHLKYMSLLSVVLLCLSLAASAQPSKIIPRDRLGDSVILKDISETSTEIQPRQNPKMGAVTIGPAIYSDGIGLMLNVSKNFGSGQFGSRQEEKYYHSHVLQLEISERYHRKEYKEISYVEVLQMIFGVNTFSYGKINNVYNIRLNYGQRRLLGGRGEGNSPLIQYYGMAGLNAALVKPYYVRLYGGSELKYSEDRAREFLSKESIEGKAGFGRGLNEIQTVMGLNLRGGLYIDFAKKSKRASAVDIGVGLDYMFNPIQQMVNMKNDQWFFNIFVSYQWGKKF